MYLHSVNANPLTVKSVLQLKVVSVVLITDCQAATLHLKLLKLVRHIDTSAVNRRY